MSTEGLIRGLSARVGEMNNVLRTLIVERFILLTESYYPEEDTQKLLKAFSNIKLDREGPRLTELRESVKSILSESASIEIPDLDKVILRELGEYILSGFG